MSRETYTDATAGEDNPRRLFVFNGGLITQRRVRRILSLAGWQIRFGRPSPEDWVGVWGRSPTAHRGEAMAARYGAPILRIEDAFLRSVRTGREGAQPHGLLLDRSGVHFDARTPSDLEQLIRDDPLDNTALLNRARAASARLKDLHLSKYNAFDPALPVPDAPYVLVIDQTRGDASIAHGGVSDALFREMLVIAQEEHPGTKVVIKTHPETQAGLRQGHYGPADVTPRVSLVREPVSPWRLFEGAVGVYTVSSQLGFEAILAGHKPRVFGAPFYAGWGLTQDETPLQHRHRKLTRAQLFAAAMILYPTWYDPYRDALCEIETVIDSLEAQAQAWRADRRGYVASGVRLWKRATVQKVFGGVARVRFDDALDRAATQAEAADKPLMIWASKAPPALASPSKMVRVEDGFIRSRGLGAALVPPLSLVLDDLGIYYDPNGESRLERMIAEAAALPDTALERARALIRDIRLRGISKYNLAGAAFPDLPDGYRILIPGQVEDDASVRLGCAAVASNRDLVKAVRAANPQAVLLYKPHPDVEAGLRPGALDPESAAKVDLVLRGADPVALLDRVQEVWTMTSLMGFEALIRGGSVTCLGVPFYAGWGLTTDLAQTPDRRRAQPSIAALAHAALIAYPRYHDPITGLACPPEIAIERIAEGQVPRAGLGNRLLAKAQGVFASQAWLWRR
ncbi:MAG: capsular polysaccharide biosynthesis protein [Pseudomonadota bacterium]